MRWTLKNARRSREVRPLDCSSLIAHLDHISELLEKAKWAWAMRVDREPHGRSTSVVGLTRDGTLIVACPDQVVRYEFRRRIQPIARSLAALVPGICRISLVVEEEAPGWEAYRLKRLHDNEPRAPTTNSLTQAKGW